ncbi:MAG TPA: winged helix-turn-helix transcriptional regulator [Methanocorpusculum sp.]|nr:winged helix-turn-helix transcriptional regulator [Methanocorpusculum sp.]
MMSTEEQEQEINSILEVIKSKPDGIAQSELWKELGIDSKKCSRILKKLEDDKLIKREKYRLGSVSTYLVTYLSVPKKVDTMLLMAGDSIVPCVACSEECDVLNCQMLEDWIYELVFSEIE